MVYYLNEQCEKDKLLFLLDYQQIYFLKRYCYKRPDFYVDIVTFYYIKQRICMISASSCIAKGIFAISESKAINEWKLFQNSICSM